MTLFARHVLNVVRRIPTGRLITYGEVARLAGQPGAARAAGSVLRRAAEPSLPYHRVVGARGQLGGYGRNPALKAALLRAEGHTIRGRRIVGFQSVRWPQ